MPDTLKPKKDVVFYETSYREVQHPRIEFKTGSLILIIPKEWKETEEELLMKHEDWILKRHKQIKAALSEGRKRELIRNRDIHIFREYVREVSREYLDSLKLKGRKIRFRYMKTKWASCSNGSMTFNTLLSYLPDELIKYAVYHEAIHLIEKKHNQRFWDLIEKEFKDVRSKEQDLLTYWFLIQKKGDIIS